jgi:hypothetical protein
MIYEALNFFSFTSSTLLTNLHYLEIVKDSANVCDCSFYTHLWMCKSE